MPRFDEIYQDYQDWTRLTDIYRDLSRLCLITEIYQYYQNVSRCKQKIMSNILQIAANANISYLSIGLW